MALLKISDDLIFGVACSTLFSHLSGKWSLCQSLSKKLSQEQPPGKTGQNVSTYVKCQ